MGGVDFPASDCNVSHIQQIEQSNVENEEILQHVEPALLVDTSYGHHNGREKKAPEYDNGVRSDVAMEVKIKDAQKQDPCDEQKARPEPCVVFERASVSIVKGFEFAYPGKQSAALNAEEGE